MVDIKNDLTTKDVYLYGAGNFGKWAYSQLKNHINFIGFLDKNPKSKEVINPFTSSINKNNSIVIVTIMNRDVDYLKLYNDLNNIGFNTIMSIYELYKYPQLHLPDWYWMSSNTDFLNKKNIDLIHSLLSDKISKNIFEDTIKSRTSFNIKYLPKTNPIEEQYFSKDIPLLEFNHFIDCGAIDGDTLDYMVKTDNTCENYYAFEPDNKNYAILTEKMRKYKQKGVAIPCGVWSSTEIMKFSTESTEGSKITDNTLQFNTIQCVAIDDIFPAIFSDTFLKMDIEGAEYEAIIGGKKTIKKINNIAVCLYHKPADIIKIPIILNNIGNFQFYLRQYGFFGMELVLFAIKNGSF